MPDAPSWKARFAPVPCLVTALALLTVPSPSSGDLILRGGVAQRVTAPAVLAGHVLARETVRVDPSVLAGAPESLWLELEPGEPRLAFLVDFERTLDGGFVWRGRFPEDDPGYRSITLSVHEGTLHGNLEAGAVDYSLRPAAGGATELVTLAAGRPVDCALGRDGAGPDRVSDGLAGDDAPGTPDLAPPPPPAVARADAAADDRTLYFLVVHSSRLTELWGGRPYAVAYAHHAIDALNTTFKNSRIDGAAALAEVLEWDAPPGVTNVPLIMRRAAGDAGVRATRDQVGADAVVVLTDSESSHGGCGISNLMLKSTMGPQFAGNAYSITNAECDGFDHQTFVHEIGHNLGAQHDRDIGSPPDVAVFPYAFAHSADYFSTIMSYQGKTRLLFSNPLVLVDGVPAGVENERDNARALQQTIPIVAAFRTGGSALPRPNVPAPVPPPPPPPIETPAAPTELRATAVSATEVGLRWKDNGSGEIAFRVEGRREDTAGYGALAEVPRNTIRHTVTGLEPGTAYRFRVKALGAQADSHHTPELKVTTLQTAPAAPTLLEADVLSASAANLRFVPVAGATGYEVAVRTADPAADRSGEPIVVGDEGATVTGLAAATPYTFRVRAVNAAGVSDWSSPASVTTAGAGGPCLADGSTLCLLAGRFEVRALWRNPHAPFGHGAAAAEAAPGSERTGLFTFFDPDNVELVVKMLDGRAVNGAFWHFYGALSDVEYWISVRDVEGDASRTYHNPPFELCGRGDTAAFLDGPEGPAALSSGAAMPLLGVSAARAGSSRAAAGAEGPCAPGPENLCLAGGRFRVEVAWENPHGAGGTGVGQVYDGLEGDRSGHFWFFRPDNLELSVKVLDGRAINGHFWILWGALSDVGYTIRVTDTETGAAHDFENPPLTLCGGAVTDLL